VHAWGRAQGEKVEEKGTREKLFGAGGD